jgi:ADP-ribosylglycohydrolase
VTTWSSVLRGCAYGDAWGNANEFKSYQQLTADDPRGPDLPERLVITDDTQMTLSLARALNGAGGKSDDELRRDIVEEFVVWLKDPDNDRAPGNTCLAATRRLAEGEPWTNATVLGSDGCGAIMRVSATAFLGAKRLNGVAAWQAAVTHGSPAAICASILTAAMIRLAPTGKFKPGEAIQVALDFLTWRRLEMNVSQWLAGHPLLKSDEDVELFLWDGFDAVRGCLEKAQAVLPSFRFNPWAGDPCASVGEGWRAQETLALALLCVDALPGEPVEALRRATVTTGDSDSIAAVAGAVLGALYRDPWPAEWDARLEPRYQNWIAEAEQYSFRDPQPMRRRPYSRRSEFDRGQW